jgi:hypothetical protein
MPRTRAGSHPFDQLIHRAAELIAQRLAPMLARGQQASGGGRGKGALSANERRSLAMRGRKLDMSCRVGGCKNRSGGPRWGFICDDHRSKLSAKQQQAARDAWKAKRAA